MPIASRVAAEVLRVLPRKHISRFMGQLADIEASPALVKQAIETFVRAYDVDMSEAIVPPQGFGSFDAFFTRELKPGARVIDARPDVIVSPVVPPRDTRRLSLICPVSAWVQRPSSRSPSTRTSPR